MSPPTLRPCEVCGRHVQSHPGAPPCPFCAASASSSSRSFVAFVVAGASLVACHNTATPPGDAAVVPTATVAPAAPSAAVAPADASATTSDNDAGLGLGALAGGDLRDGDGGGGGLLKMGRLGREMAAVYGPAPSDLRSDGGTMIVGDVQMGTPTVTKGALTNHERVLAGARARLRSCYTKGLQSDPSQKGAVSFTLDIAANGEVSKAKATGPTLSPEVISCMKSTLGRLVFDAPGTPAQVTLKANLAPQQR
ncbi:MAG: hypothetical protein JWM74_2155 [Myxococcaceae bacterium]|nr:hypothetical protein [Myxococcaceae bacterium]